MWGVEQTDKRSKRENAELLAKTRQHNANITGQMKANTAAKAANKVEERATFEKNIAFQRECMDKSGALRVI